MLILTILFWITVICLSYAGFKLIINGFMGRKRNRIIFRRVAFNDIRDYITDVESKHDIKGFFKHTGLSISLNDYIAVRLVILSLLAIVALLYIVSFGGEPIFTILVYLAVAYITLPRNTFVGIKTPMSLFIDFARNNYLASVELELFRILTVLKNLIITCKKTPVSAENIISNLVEFAKLTKPKFTEFLSLYRLGKIEQAYNYFKNEIGTKLGEDLASLLIKLDEINPAELIEQLELYQSTIRDRCMTERLKKDKLISDVAFFPVVVSIFLILMNFIAITLFIDGMDTFSHIFG